MVLILFFWSLLRTPTPVPDPGFFDLEKVRMGSEACPCEPLPLLG